MFKLYVPCLCLFFSLTVMPFNAAAEKRDVCFVNSTTDVIKTNCYWLKGKNDHNAVLKCFNQKVRKYLEFDPGTEWVEKPGYSPECLPPKIKGVDLYFLPKGHSKDKGTEGKYE